MYFQTIKWPIFWANDKKKKPCRSGGENGLGNPQSADRKDKFLATWLDVWRLSDTKMPFLFCKRKRPAWSLFGRIYRR